MMMTWEEAENLLKSKDKSIIYEVGYFNKENCKLLSENDLSDFNCCEIEKEKIIIYKEYTGESKLNYLNSKIKFGYWLENSSELLYSIEYIKRLS